MRRRKSFLGRNICVVLTLTMAVTCVPESILAAEVSETQAEGSVVGGNVTEAEEEFLSENQSEDYGIIGAMVEEDEEPADSGMTELGMDLEKEVNPSNDIPAYQPKDFWSTTTVTPKPINIVEFTTKNKVTAVVEFSLFNSTLQKEMGDVDSENGVLQLPELIVDHNYILFPADPKYRMVMSDGKPEVSEKSVNMYFWLKPDGKMMDIKMGLTDEHGKPTDPDPDKPDGIVDTYNYPEMTDIYVRERTTPSANPRDDRRANVNIKVIFKKNESAKLFNHEFKLISNKEEISVSSGGSGTIVASLLEDEDYTVIPAGDFVIDVFPLAVKDKSEYTSADGGTRGGTYPYDHSDCNRVDDISVTTQADIEKGAKYKPVIENPDQTVSVSGMNFKDIIVRTDTYSIKGDDERFSGVNGTAIDIYTINNHRWEIANLSGPTFKVTVKSSIPAESINKAYLCNPTDLTSKEIMFRTTSDPNEIEFDTTALGTSTIALEYDISLIAQSKIDEVKKKLSDEEKRHTVATFKPFSEAVKELERVLGEESSSQGEIKAAYDKLVEAENQLELKLSDTTRTAITEARAARDKLDSKKYTESIWKNYSDAVEAALKIAASEDPSEKEGVEALSEVEAARTALKYLEGWKKDGGGKWYYFENGKKVIGWRQDVGKWYYLSGENDGAMVIGWKKIGGIWYYLNPGGDMATGWKWIGGSWYYLNPGGDMAIGWKWIGGSWYYLNPGGDMAVGWKQISGKWYYLNHGGDMATGWVKDRGKWYYLNPDGVWVS